MPFAYIFGHVLMVNVCWCDLLGYVLMCMKVVVGECAQGCNITKYKINLVLKIKS